MAIIGWLVCLALMLYISFIVVAANVFSFAIAGKSAGKIENIIGSIIFFAGWYAVFHFCPFSITVG